MAASGSLSPAGDQGTTNFSGTWTRLYRRLREEPRVEKTSAWLQKRAKETTASLQKNQLWQRMLKNTLAVTITVILALIPAVTKIYGKAMYLGCMTAVFGHAGRRFGQMADALVLVIAGTVLGVAWSMLGLYLSSLVYDANSPAAYAIRGIFLVIAILFHGFLRSHTPRLWIFVLLLAIVCVVSLTSTAKAVTASAVTIVLYPILTACGVLLLVNTLIFPEFASDCLGITTINTLCQTVDVLRDAGTYFASAEDGSSQLESKVRTANEVAGLKASSSEHTQAREDSVSKPINLKTLTGSKVKLRSGLATCKATQQELNFEIAWSVLPPQDLKPVSGHAMRKLVANVIALIGACESKYACIGDREDMVEAESKDRDQLRAVAEAAKLSVGEDDTQHQDPHKLHTGSKRDRKKLSHWRISQDKTKTDLERDIADLALVKPRKEIEFGDIQLLRSLVERTAKPLSDLQTSIDHATSAVVSCLSYCYDVPKLPSGTMTPKTIDLRDIDANVDSLVDSLAQFDQDSAGALESAAELHDLAIPQVDIMPRMEVFLISSFLLNYRQAALHTLHMLESSRILVEKYHARHGKPRIYTPRIKWREWLASGGEQDAFVMPEYAKKDVRTGKKEEDPDDSLSSPFSSQQNLVGGVKEVDRGRASPPKSSTGSTSRPSNINPPTRSILLRSRNKVADFTESIAESEDVLYAVKLAIAVFLVIWPAFVGQFNAWYSLNRGIWAALQLVLVTEVAIGISIWTFVLRLFGTMIGCSWGWTAYEARSGNPYVIVVMLVIGIIPSTYIQLGSQYVKAGMVSIISMCIVALATADQTVPGSATENYLKRLIAFLIGGTVALFVEIVLLPIKARDRLVESIASSLIQITEMEACLAHGIESEANVNVHEPAVRSRFERAKNKAQGALGAAETFLPFCGKEPRLKGSFKGLTLVYGELLYVLHSIVDRMDNMLVLRTDYGSGVLEEINEKVFPYRRNVAGSMTLVLFAVHEALVTKLPLPQFLPSARLAHLRMVNRVREVVMNADTEYLQNDGTDQKPDMNLTKRIVRQKFLSWNATSAGQIEVIEYLEELVDLTKLLVGVHEFRSGILTRDTYRALVETMTTAVGGDASADVPEDCQGEVPELAAHRRLGQTARRAITLQKLEAERTKAAEQDTVEKKIQDEADAPRPLQRVRTKRMEEMHLKLAKSRESDKHKQKRS